MYMRTILTFFSWFFIYVSSVLLKEMKITHFISLSCLILPWREDIPQCAIVRRPFFRSSDALAPVNQFISDRTIRNPHILFICCY